ncbi:hypothetical protein [Burkholderia sp. LMG 21824]|uniref:hypothetical protein n=1 Tax=Burkholderia sp. LMG 21824 TaxID=3158172 RepID=UPI003C2FB9A0
MAASFEERNLPSYRETTAARRAGWVNAERRTPSTGKRIDAYPRVANPMRETPCDVATMNGMPVGRPHAGLMFRAGPLPRQGRRVRAA